MPNPDPTPPPKGSGKFAVIAGAIVLLIIVVTFVGMNAQHAVDTTAPRSGEIKAREAPMHERDLGKAPLQPK